MGVVPGRSTRSLGVMANKIQCEQHGLSVAASVCGHLVKNLGAPLGFIENSVDPNNKQGWCYACEMVYEQEQEKSQRFLEFCQHVVVCSSCYDQIKEHHDFDGEGANDA